MAVEGEADVEVAVEVARAFRRRVFSLGRSLTLSQSQREPLGRPRRERRVPRPKREHSAGVAGAARLGRPAAPAARPAGRQVARPAAQGWRPAPASGAARPGAAAGQRPASGSGAANRAAGSRPTSGQLNNFLDVPGPATGAVGAAGADGGAVQRGGTSGRRSGRFPARRRDDNSRRELSAVPP